MNSHFSEPLGKDALFNTGPEICKKLVHLPLTNCSVDKYIIKDITVTTSFETMVMLSRLLLWFCCFHIFLIQF